jgi:hypothetical protein
VSDSLAKLLLRRTDGKPGAVLWGREAQPYFGRAFDWLLARRVLVERSPADSWPVCPACDGTCGDRPIVEINGALVAACPEDHARDTTLLPHDIRSFRIDTAALIGAIAAASGLAGEPAAIVDGVWDVGRTAAGRAVVMVLDRAQAANTRLLALLHALVPAADKTILLPDDVAAADCMRIRDAGVHAVAVSEALAASGFALVATMLVPGPALLPRLVIDRAAQAVTLDGRACSLADQPFRLLALLADRARTGRHDVQVRGIEDAIWRGQAMPGSRQIRDIVRELRDAMVSAGIDRATASGLVENRRNPSRYRLTLQAEDIDLRG